MRQRCTLGFSWSTACMVMLFIFWLDLLSCSYCTFQFNLINVYLRFQAGGLWGLRCRGWWRWNSLWALRLCRFHAGLWSRFRWTGPHTRCIDITYKQSRVALSSTVSCDSSSRELIYFMSEKRSVLYKWTLEMVWFFLIFLLHDANGVLWKVYICDWVEAVFQHLFR